MEIVDYEAPFFLTAENEEVGLSHLFYVKLKKDEDSAKLKDLAKKHNVEILGNNEFMPLWYTLACDKNSSGNALEVANTFYESKLLQCAEPDIMAKTSINCVNDTYFGNHWGLRNVGQFMLSGICNSALILFVEL